MSGKRVLVVDDSRTSRRILGGVLVELGCELVGEARNGLEGYEKYKELKPDIVTMDITMPVMDGVESLRKIKAEFPDAKVVMVTAASQKHTMMEAIKEGATEFIAKPFDVETIKRAIGL